MWSTINGKYGKTECHMNCDCVGVVRRNKMMIMIIRYIILKLKDQGLEVSKSATV